MRRLAVAVMSGAAFAVACSSFSAEPAPSPAGTDASSDGTASDAATQPDGAPREPDGAAPTGFCADPAAHDLCEDFDEASLATDEWQPGQQSTPDAGLAQIDPGQAKSPPGALLVTLSTRGFAAQRSFFIHRNITRSASKTIAVAFDLFVDVLEQGDAAATADSVVLLIGDGAYTNQIRVASASGLLVVDVVQSALPKYDSARYTFGAHTFPVKQWHRFVLTSDRSKNTVALSIDDAPGQPPASTSFFVPSTPAVNLGLDLGSQTDTTGETIRLYYDNVTVDLDR